MAAVAAGYRMGLVRAGWPVLLLSYTNECRKQSFHLVGALFLAFQAAFSLEECFLGQRVLTIERSVMSGCGQGHEPGKNFFTENASTKISMSASRGQWTYICLCETSEGSCGSSFSG